MRFNVKTRHWTRTLKLINSPTLFYWLKAEMFQLDWVKAGLFHLLLLQCGQVRCADIPVFSQLGSSSLTSPFSLSVCSLSREVDAVLRFLKDQFGAKHIGAVGFCWGGIAVHYLALQYPEFKAGVSVYGKVTVILACFILSLHLIAFKFTWLFSLKVLPLCLT